MEIWIPQTDHWRLPGSVNVTSDGRSALAGLDGCQCGTAGLSQYINAPTGGNAHERMHARAYTGSMYVSPRVRADKLKQNRR